MAGVQPHRIREQRYVLDVTHRADRPRSPRRTMHTASVQLHDAFFIGMAAEANALVIGIIFGTLNDFQRSIQSVSAAGKKCISCVQIGETVCGADDHGQLRFAGRRITLRCRSLSTCDFAGDGESGGTDQSGVHEIPARDGHAYESPFCGKESYTTPPITLHYTALNRYSEFIERYIAVKCDSETTAYFCRRTIRKSERFSLVCSAISALSIEGVNAGNRDLQHMAHHLSEHESSLNALASEAVEIAEAIVLAIVAIATAWSGYQAALWTGHQAELYGESSKLRIKAEDSATTANQERLYIAATVVEWLKAEARGETKLADLSERRILPEFQPAFEAWKKTDPINNRNAPAGPSIDDGVPEL